jgi:polysaccharide biosynthesis transport protein
MSFGEEKDRPFHPLKPVPAGGGQIAPYDPRTLVPEEDDSIDLREYWRILFKRKWLILAVLAIVIVATFMATRLQVPEYRATTSVMIQMPAQSTVLAIQDYDSAWYRHQEFLPTQLQILNSRALAEAVVRREGLEDHPQLTGQVRQRSLLSEARQLARLVVNAIRPAPEVEAAEVANSEPADPVAAAAARLRAGLQVEPVRNSSVVNVSFVSFDPEFAARMANALVREYTRDSVQRRMESGLEAREFLEEQLESMRIAIERSDRELADFARRAGAANLSDNLEMARTGLRSLNDRLEEVQRELVQLSGWRDLVQQGLVDHLDPVANSASIADLRTRLVDASAEYATLSERFLDSYPTVAEVLRRMELLRQEIASEKQNIANGIIGRFDTLSAQEVALRDAIAERESRLMTLNERGVQYNILRREFEANQELYDGILQRLKEVGVVAGIQENNISVVDAARAPGGPFRPDLRKNLAIASLLGLMVGVGLALLLEFLDNTIRRVEDVERLVDRPVLGMVPLVRGRERSKEPVKAHGPGRDLSHVCATHPKSSMSEAFRSLRTSLMFSTPEGMPKSLLVTSSAQGEGKSTTAANIATVLAQNGARVLLIDADLRRPSLHKDFAQPRSPGLTNCIAQAERAGTPVDGPAIHATSVPGLSVMPAGHSTPSPAELLSSSRLVKVLADCRQLFDHVIVDAPPILGLADAVILSRIVDGVVLVAASGSTGKENFRMSVRRLRQVQAPLLGVVLNRVDLESPEYAYYSAYYYHYEGEQDHRESALPGLRKAS